MSVSSDLISQFVKATKTENEKPSETTVYATVVYDGKTYVKIDGSDLLTPVSTTANVKDGERVTVLIKDHTATITGNMSSPAARTGDVEAVGSKISEFEIVMAYKVTTEDLEAINATIENIRSSFIGTENLEAINADIDNLIAKYAELQYVDAENIEALYAEIDHLEARVGEFTDISTEELEAINAEITNLRGYTADFTYVSADVLEAVKASIKNLDAEKLTATDADIQYVNIDFAKIDKTWMAEFYAQSGLIENATMGDATITGRLVGVTILGDMIEGNTIKADKLVIKGEDGLYYKLNFEAGEFTSAEEVPTDSLHGSIITAQSITAEKISVHDLVAFGATIGGFNITSNSLYSGVKSSANNSTNGVYLDNDGQLVLGDSNNYLKYYKVVDNNGEDVLDDNGNPTYKLEISADSILFGAGSKSSASDLKALTEHVKIGTYEDPETGDDKPCIELSEGDSNFKQVITNTKTMFMDGANVGTEINNEGIETDMITVKHDFRQTAPNQTGQWVWAVRANGNYGLSWKGASS